MKLAGLTACNSLEEEMKAKQKDRLREERDGKRQLRKGCNYSSREQRQILLLTQGRQWRGPHSPWLSWDSRDGWWGAESSLLQHLPLSKAGNRGLALCLLSSGISKSKANRNELSSEKKPAHKQTSFLAISTQTLANQAANALAKMTPS